jgi:hypothetical protein
MNADLIPGMGRTVASSEVIGGPKWTTAGVQCCSRRRVFGKGRSLAILFAKSGKTCRTFAELWAARSVRIGQLQLANRRIQPLCHLSAVRAGKRCV